MKTRELIKQLQDADPSGELECCVDNQDIHFIFVQPGNYDGLLEILVRDQAQKGFNVVGGILQCKGRKVRIRTLSLEDCLFEFDNNFPITIVADDDSNRKLAQKQIDTWKENVRKELGKT